MKLINTARASPYLPKGQILGQLIFNLNTLLFKLGGESGGHLFDEAIKITIAPPKHNLL
jgi:hypothetical protein